VAETSLKRIAGLSSFLVLIALTIYALILQNQDLNILSKSADMALTASAHATANYRTYVGRYKETKIKLDETTRKLEEVNRQLDQVTTELATTKGMLSQTQGMLVSAQEENAKLKQELQGLDDLTNRDAQVSLQLAELKSQLRAFHAEFSNLDEGRSLIILFQNKIKFIKSRMHYLKQEAFLTRIAVQKEKDRLAALSGNSGFVLRNGQEQNPNGTKRSFAIDVQIVP